MLTTDLYFCDAEGNYYIFKDVEALGVSIRTYSERSQSSTQEPKRDPSGPEGTACTLQATDQRPTVRSQTPALR